MKLRILEILEEKGYSIDEDGFKACMEEQRVKARTARKETNYMGADATVYDEIDPSITTEFVGYDNDVYDSKITVLTTDQIMDVTVETDGEQTMYIAYDETKEKPWQLTTPEGTFDGDSDAVTSALGKYNSYSVKSVVEYNCADFSRYGLEEPATVVTVRYTEEEETEEATVKTLVFEFGNKNEEESGTYVRINGSPYVYTMTEYYVEGVSVFDLEELKYQLEEGAEETTE